MATQNKAYQFKGNPIIEGVPVIGNLVYDKIGKEVLAVHNERFKDISNIEDTTEYKDGQSILFSNTPRILSYNQILNERFPDMSVLSPEQVVQYWNILPERGSTYADTDSVAVYPREGDNEQLRKRVLDITGKTGTEVHLAVSGLGVEKSNNSYGFTFIETPYIKAKEAPWLEIDGQVAYDAEKDCLVSVQEGGVPVLTAGSGLGGLFRDWSDGLSAWSGSLSLLISGGSGRVQVLYDPQGRAETLEAKLSQLKNQRAQQIAEIEGNYNLAEVVLRTGKLPQQEPF